MTVTLTMQQEVMLRVMMVTIFRTQFTMNYGIKIFNNLHELENFFLTEQSLQLTYLKES